MKKIEIEQLKKDLQTERERVKYWSDKFKELEIRYDEANKHRCSHTVYYPPIQPAQPSPQYCQWCNSTPCKTGFHVIC